MVVSRVNQKPKCKKTTEYNKYADSNNDDDDNNNGQSILR